MQEVELLQGKAFTCSYMCCPGYNFKPALQCVVCHAEVHPPCVSLVIEGQQAEPGNSYCSTQCIRYFGDDNINHDQIQQEREVLSSQTKANLRQLARQLGLKISVRIPGQGSRDLPKDAIICKIIEKRYVNDSIANTAPQLDTENVTIHDNFV